MNWELIESDAALEAVLEGLQSCTAVAVDTEFMRTNTFYPKVALLQLCYGDTAWLIDPLTIKDTSSIARFLTDERIVKVLHSASEDLEVFQHWLGVLPSPLFDTQRAAGLLNRGFGLGYRAIVQSLCDVDLPKGETRSDWLQRPLTQSQCEYAAQDVVYLLRVYNLLKEESLAQDKYDWVLADGADARVNLASIAADYYKKIKTAWKLDSRQLGILSAVSHWREATARSKDKPRSWIIDDKACLALAQLDPRDSTQLQQIDLPSPARRRYGDALLEALEKQREMAPAFLPEALPEPLTPQQRNGVKQLKSRARSIADELKLAPEILLQAKDYELLLRQGAGQTVEEPVHWRGWRRDLVIEPLKQLVRDTLI